MIHEFIDPKKKPVKNKHGKILSVNKTNFENSFNFQQSDGNECKNTQSLSVTFIPPWLRNSLGLNQRNNQSHANNEPKPPRLIPKLKERGHLESRNSCKESSDQLRHCELEVTTIQAGPDVVKASQNHDEQALGMLWNNMHKRSQGDLKHQSPDFSILNAAGSKITTVDCNVVDIEKLREDEKKRVKLVRQKNRVRKRIMAEHKTVVLEKSDVDALLEIKAREVLEDYMKKNVHSVNSDMKQLEAKLILLSAKCQDSDFSKLSQQEIRLLQEVKDQTGNSESFSKVLDHIKESHLREIFEAPTTSARIINEYVKKNEEEKVKVSDEQALDKDSAMSTDDENDIKRFSEFLSKNKNMDEKRKCLEEVRNYFERKRRTRLTKHRYVDEERMPKPSENIVMEKKDDEREKQRILITSKSRKSKFEICEEEIVEKAVNETLQKFIELYNFNVSPFVLNSMRRNILQAIQSDSLDSKPSKQNLLEIESQEYANGKTENQVGKTPAPLIDSDKDAERREHSALSEGMENMEIRDSLPNENKKNVKILLNSSRTEERLPSSGKEHDVVENENVKRLKQELQCFLNSVKADVANLKLIQLMVEKEMEDSPYTSLKFAYNFADKRLERVKSESKNLKDHETQTNPTTTQPLKRNVKTQSMRKLTIDQGLQTNEKTYMTRDVQTEGEDLKVEELTELKNFDVAPGLYRMVKSKEAGKFYLYPENAGDAKIVCNCNSSILRTTDCEEKINEGFMGKLKEKPKKEKKTIVRQKRPNKSRKKKSSFNLAHSLRYRRKLKGPEKLKNSFSCLYFRNFPNTASDGFANSSTTVEEILNDKMRMRSDRKHPLEHTWLWNGEKISPGCDLKTHVEDLLMEKLKEIAETQNSRDYSASKIEEMEVGKGECNTKICHAETKLIGEGLKVQDERELICVKKASIVHVEGNPIVYTAQIEEIKVAEGDEKKEAAESELSAQGEKSVKDVGIQNSNLIPETFLAVHSIQNEPPGMAGKTRKKLNLTLCRDAEEDFINYKKTADIVNAVREMRLDFKNDSNSNNNDEDNSIDSCTTLEESLSSSTTKNSLEDPLTILLALKKCWEFNKSTSPDEENKMKKEIDLVESEVQENVEDVSSSDNPVLESVDGNQKYWKLVENLLSTVGINERDVLWNDVREFLKTKVGRDINEEGAREVCIEIEQDLPKSGEEEMKQTVSAKGHFNRSEGDVEIEIDLTLEDLERILRHRQKKIRRRQISQIPRSRKFLPVFSIGNLKKDDLNRYQKYVSMLPNLSGGLMFDKELKMLLKNKN